MRWEPGHEPLAILPRMQPVPADASIADLATQLKQGTHDLHRAAERSGFMRRMLSGDLDCDLYCRLLVNLHAIYRALETSLERHAGAGPVSRVHAPALSRTAALQADLDALHGGDWRQSIPLTAAAESYVERVRWLDETEPMLLVAHSYVRYLGDLSGGQVLGRVVAGALGLHDGRGTSFYTFGPPGAAALASRYRQGLSAIQLDEASALRVVNEARDSFQRHCAMFEELG